MKLPAAPFLALLLSSTPLLASNVIFLHPDGAGIAHWQAARFFQVGPDGTLNWDRLPHVGVYRGHLSDTLTSTSNGGATVHAYGVKMPAAAFGSDGVTATPPKSAGGESLSLMQEAQTKGFRVGIINSGSVIEPGTAAFLSSVATRADYAEITRQLVESGADVILSGGEEWFLPKGTTGRHTTSGKREDGQDLIARARELGYTVVFDEKELAAVPADTKKLLGIFAAANTFNDLTEDQISATNLPLYAKGAPSLAAMMAKALEIFGTDPFFLVAEEEGSDNFGNKNNGPGTLEALRRADEAFGVALDFVEKNPDTLLITAADSGAGAMDVLGIPNSPEAIAVAQNSRDTNGAPFSLNQDGKPFESQPDAAGRTHRFVITWATRNDASGGIVARAAGKNAELVTGSIDNTDIYKIMRRTLFGE